MFSPAQFYAVGVITETYVFRFPVFRHDKGVATRGINDRAFKWWGDNGKPQRFKFEGVTVHVFRTSRLKRKWVKNDRPAS